MNRIRKFAMLFVAFFVAIQLYGQTPAQKQRLEMKKLLHELIKQHDNLGYNGLWAAYATTDVDATGHIIDMYSNITNYTPDSHGGSYKVEGDYLNREHTVPQSWFGEAAPMVADLFHVYPVDGWVNGMRSDNPYGEVATVSKTSANEYSKLGTPKASLGAPSTVTKVFEPADEWKGDLARAYFYMVVCYQDVLSGWTGPIFGSTSAPDKFTNYVGYPGMAEWELRMLIRWAKNDPVSDIEKKRNNEVYKLQGNRNPFIDCPGLERFIWYDFVEE